MNLPIPSETREARFAGYVDALAEGLGHADRIAPMQAYCTGLLLLGERKSIESMAARLASSATRRPTNPCITLWLRLSGLSADLRNSHHVRNLIQNCKLEVRLGSFSPEG